jgi:hypothetical protein
MMPTGCIISSFKKTKREYQHQLINDSSTKDFPMDKEITEAVFF